MRSLLFLAPLYSLRNWSTKKWWNRPGSCSLFVADLWFELMHPGSRACILDEYTANTFQLWILHNTIENTFNILNCEEWCKKKFQLQKKKKNGYTKPNLTWSCQGNPLESTDFEADLKDKEDRERQWWGGWNSVSAE